MFPRLLFSIIMAAAAIFPACADNLVTTTQAVAGQAAGALPQAGAGVTNVIGNNYSSIMQAGTSNTATINQFGTGDMARVDQYGSNFNATILQTSQQDSVVVSQFGNGAGLQPVSVTQTGPGQSIIITQHR